MSPADETVLAIDIGGTQIKAGLITRAGQLLALQRLDTAAQADPQVVIQAVIRTCQELCSQAKLALPELKGLGISIAAFITADGLVTATAHLARSWVGLDLRERLLRAIPLPTYFALDTPAPTLGEAYYGAGQEVSDLVYITVSTGIGAGILAGRAYYTGGLGWAGGVGHTIIDENSERVCEGCGNHGCLETFAARQGILLSALEAATAQPDSLLTRLQRANPQHFSPRTVYEAASQGDAAAIGVFRQAGHALGIGLTNLVDIVSPQRVIVGGGIALAGDLLLEPARQVVRERAFPPQNRQVEIIPAALHDLSGIYGAAAMVFHDIRVNV